MNLWVHLMKLVFKLRFLYATEEKSSIQHQLNRTMDDTDQANKKDNSDRLTKSFFSYNRKSK